MAPPIIGLETHELTVSTSVENPYKREIIQIFKTDATFIASADPAK
jgi:hypothetical protein